MANMDHIIEPDRQGIWIAATFIVALLALVVAIVGVSRNNDLMYMTQTELLLINDKIEALQTGAPPASSTCYNSRIELNLSLNYSTCS